MRIKQVVEAFAVTPANTCKIQHADSIGRTKDGKYRAVICEVNKS